MLRLLVIQLEDFLEFLAVVVLPGLVGIIVLLGKGIGIGGSLLGSASVGRSFLGGSGLCNSGCLLGSGLCNGGSLISSGLCNGLGESHTAHLGQLAHFALDFIGYHLGRVLLTQTAGDEHQSFNLIDMR